MQAPDVRARAGLNEADALRVLLLRELESATPPQAALWSASDRDWASRAALDAVGRAAGAQQFLVERANQALQRLRPRLPELQAWFARRVWRDSWLVWVIFGSGLVGLAIDSLGNTRHINLLAPPLWGVMVWNVVVYALLLAPAPRLRIARPGWLIRAVQGTFTFSNAAAGHATVLRSLAPAWLRASGPQNAARAAMLLHGASAALALGLIAGLYLRGLVFDYRAAWQSTFLDASSVHAVLSFVLGPAAHLSGIALPDARAVEALRLGAAAGDASAAPWIHLLATSLALLVVLPRLALCAASAWRARRLASRVELPLHEPYFQRLLREQRGEVARVRVVPYAQPPAEPLVTALRALLAQTLGPDVQLSLGATLAFGAEDDATPASLLPTGTTHALLLVDMAATPEAEHHGRSAATLAGAALARGAVALLLVPQAAFVRRFAPTPQRIVERRAAWQALADAAGLPLLALHLDAAHAAADSAELQAALDGAARAAASTVAP